MDWRSQCAVVIPCLNEANRIGTLVEAVRKHLPAVVVVDDGSKDGTDEAARRAGAEVLAHEIPLGKGAALRAGWRGALARGFSWALTLDGDGQHAPEDIPVFLACGEGAGADLVVGNRMGNAARMPWVRREVNRWMSRRLSLATGRSLPDTQCGFRLMRLPAWAGLVITANHFEIESEVLLAFIRAGLKVEFVPVRVIYQGERSKIDPVADTLRWFRWWKEARRAADS